jgi:hypothetical protein
MDSLNRLLEHARPLICSIVEYRSTTRHAELAELVQLCQIKIWRSLRLYDRARGTSFSFIARIISSVSASVVADIWRRSERFISMEECRRQVFSGESYALEDRDLSQFQAPPADPHAIEHIEYLVRSVKTVCELSEELAAQRWYVLSFLDCESRLRRYQCADAAMAVFGLSHARARRLFDLTVLEVRRQVLAGTERRLKPIRVVDICHSKIAALERYAPLLNCEEFTRLCTLLRDLPPTLVLAVRPENAGQIMRGDVGAARENLRIILDGDPVAVPLFQA